MCRTLSSEALRGSHLDKYLSVVLSARVARIEPVESIVDGTSATFATLKVYRALVRGMGLTIDEYYISRGKMDY